MNMDQSPESNPNGAHPSSSSFLNPPPDPKDELERIVDIHMNIPSVPAVFQAHSEINHYSNLTRHERFDALDCTPLNVVISPDYHLGNLEYNHGTCRHLQFEITLAQERTTSNDDFSSAHLSSNATNFIPPIDVTNIQSEAAANSVQYSLPCARRPSAVPTNSNVLLSGSSQEGQQLLHDSNTTGLNLAVAGETYSHVNNDQHESRVILDVHSERIYGGPLYLPPSNQEGVPYNRKRCLSTLHDTNIVEELNQVTPKRGRKKASNMEGNIKVNIEGNHKSCSCKKSRCLKLYCECFANERFCDPSCGCQDCKNNSDNKDLVLESRNRTKARNPHAFNPKVTDSQVEEGTSSNLASARHRKGCKCKKSKCQQKYCECHQAGVGCSNECQCQDCNNEKGKKPETVYMRAESQNNPSDGNTNPIDCTRIGTGTTNQLPTRTSLAEISSYTPSFHPPQHFYPGNPLQPSAATWNCPPRNHVPQPVSSFEFQSNGLSSSLPPNLLEGTKGGDI